MGGGGVNNETAKANINDDEKRNKGVGDRKEDRSR